MTRTKTITFSAAVTLLSLAGCKGDPEGGRRGETCQAHADCGGDLGCYDGICAVANADLVPSVKMCVPVQCRVPKDCCSEFATTCDGSQYTCIADVCGSICKSDFDCFSSGKQHCEAGQCIECRSDTDCTSKETCVASVCKARCETAADCPAFYACEAASCVFKGCKTNRECVFYLKNALAVCQETRCQIPCESDAECDGAAGNGLMLCDSGRCLALGCETDDECRIAYDGQIPDPFMDAVCRDAPPK